MGVKYSSPLDIGFPSDNSSIVKRRSGVADGIKLLQDGETSDVWELIGFCGTVPARWYCGVVSEGNKLSVLQALLNSSLIKEIVFDSGDVVISGTLNCGGKILTFVGDGRLVGGTVNNAVLNLRINPSAVTGTKTSCTEHYYTTPSAGGGSPNLRKVDDADFTIGTGDVTVVLINNTTGRTCTLPAASSFNNRVVRIYNSGTAAVTYSVAVRIRPSTTTTTLATSQWMDLQSDGTDWWVVASGTN